MLKKGVIIFFLLGSQIVESEEQLDILQGKNVDKVSSSKNNDALKQLRRQNELSQIKYKLKKALRDRRAIQEKLNSSRIVDKNSAKNIKTTYDIPLNKLKGKLENLLAKYTHKHPDVITVKRQIKILETKRFVEVNSIATSSINNVGEQKSEIVYQNLKNKLRNLNHEIDSLNTQLLIYQNLYNDKLVNNNYGNQTQVFTHPGGLHSLKQLQDARKKIAINEKFWMTSFKAFIKQAEKGLKKFPNAVEDFDVPGYYKDAKNHKRSLMRLSNDAWTAYSCAIAYQLISGIERNKYANKVVQILDAWAIKNKRTSNHDGDLVMITAGSGLVFAAELIHSYDGWNQKKKLRFKNWLTRIYLKSCKKISSRTNNWSDWGNLGCIASHYFLDDAAALDADINNIRNRIDKSILSDGSMPLETMRGKSGIWYTYFALAPLTSASQIALNSRGIDLFQYKGIDGAGIEEALDYLLRYALEPEKWPHYKGKDLRVPNSEQWLASLFEAMHGIYGKKQYKILNKNNIPIILDGHHYAWTVPTLLQTIAHSKNEYK